ncbi:hypothetical protein D3C79_901370 [compost metagenome]
MIAARLGQPGLLLLGLHPFGGDLDPELMAEADDGAHYGGGGLVGRQPLSEASVQLEGRHLQPRQVGQGAVAGAEVVDGELKAGLDQVCEVALYLVGIFHQHPFGDLQLQLPGGYPVAFDAGEDLRAELGVTELQRRQVD